MKNVRNFDDLFDLFERNVVGFPRLALSQTTDQKYPPYNLIKDDENHFTIQLAVAGFDKDELSMSVENQNLVISGSITDDSETESKYIHRGIGLRNFSQKFVLADNVEVDNAEYVDGILTVKLVRNIPEEEKPQLIQIK